MKHHLDLLLELLDHNLGVERMLFRISKLLATAMTTGETTAMLHSTWEGYLIHNTLLHV